LNKDKPAKTTNHIAHAENSVAPST